MAREYITNVGSARNVRLYECDTDRLSVRPHLKTTKFEDRGIFRFVTEQKTEPNAFDIAVPGRFVTVRSAGDVKAHLRRIRPQEASELDEIDRQLAALHALRRAKQVEAWRKGHVVTFKEIGEWAAEWQQAKQEAR